MASCDVIIIGGGISGLSLAHLALKAGLKPCLLEKGPRLGGALSSEPFGADFWFEMGAHTAYNSYHNLIPILRDRALLPRLLKRETAKWMLWEGAAVPIAKRLRFPALLLSLPRLFWTRKSECSVAEYYSKIMGAGNYRRVGRHMFNAVTSQEAGNFPADLLFKKRPRDKSILRSFTLAGGLGVIPQTLAGADGLRVISDCAVQALAHVDGFFRVDTGAQGVLEAPALVVATPADAAAELLRESFPEVAAALSRITVRQVNSIGVVVRKEALALPPLAGLVGVEDCFHSMVSRDTVPHPLYRGFAFHFKPETPREVALQRIQDVLGVAESQFEHTTHRTHTLPAPGPGHQAWVTQLDTQLAGQPLFITGNYFGGLSIEDCVSRSAAEAGRLLRSRR